MEQSVQCAINGQKVKIFKHLPHVFYTENKTGNLHSLVPHYKWMLHRIILHEPYFSILSHIIIGNEYLQKCLVHRYSKCPLIWHPWDREVLDYQTVSMLTEVLQTIFYSFYNWAVHIISGVLCLVTSFISWFRVIRVHFCVSWSLQRCLNFGVGDKGSEYTIKVNIQALLKAFLNMPLRSACFTHTAFSGKK